MQEAGTAERTAAPAQSPASAHAAPKARNAIVPSRTSAARMKRQAVHTGQVGRGQACLAHKQLVRTSDAMKERAGKEPPAASAWLLSDASGLKRRSERRTGHVEERYL